MLSSLKIWYIKVDDVGEGPYSFLDLRRHRRVTPDTLVRKIGTNKWVPIRYVLELKDLFVDEETGPRGKEKSLKRTRSGKMQAIVMDNKQDPFNLLLWILLIVLALSYIFYLVRR